MSLQPSQNPQEVVQSPSGSDFVQYKNPNGAIVSWIDSNGFAQGALGGLNTANFSLSINQMRNLATSAVTGLPIVPPGLPNSFILPISYALWYRFGGTIYNAVALNLGYSSDTSSSFPIGLATGIGLLNIANDSVILGGYGVSLAGGTLVNATTAAKINAINGAGLNMWVNGAIGNGNGTLSGQLIYRVFQF